ncbi:MAG: hypothetical protein ACFFD6_04070, partial [Candidatus Thorarchaeota archaeon]
LSADSDGDSILDGDEAVIGTSATSNDTDGDGVGDGLEIELWLDCLHNDTDGDGVLDGQELGLGSNPWSQDSDWDGVPDGEDPDTFAGFAGTIVVAYDPAQESTSLVFIGELEKYADVIVVTVDELLESYTESRFIVLIGRPDAESEGVCGVTHDLLADTGSKLVDMMDADSHEIAVRYSVWDDNQTVVILSEAAKSDVYKVIQILRGRDVTLLPGSILIEYNVPEVFHNWTYSYYFQLDDIDIVKTTDSIVSIALVELASPTIRINRYNGSNTPHQLTRETGLAENDIAIGSYLEVALTTQGTSTDILQEATIRLYYRAADLDMNSNGMFADPEDINETTLSLYMFDETVDIWIKLTEDLDWVLGTGVNTTDVDVYGESYAGYVWAQVTHLSLFGLAGQPYQIPLPIYLYLGILLGGVAVVGIIYIFRRKRLRIKGDDD